MRHYEVMVILDPDLEERAVAPLIENFLTGRIWTLTKSNPYLRAGLTRASFTGGWLEGAVQVPIPMPRPPESPPGTLITVPAQELPATPPASPTVR